MVRSARSRPVAISTGWGSAARPVRPAAAGSIGSSARRSPAIAKFSAVRTISAWPVASGTIVAWPVASGSVLARAVATRALVAASLAKGLARLRRRSRISLGCASLRPLALEQSERRGSQLRGVEFTEQRLERNHFAWRNALRQNGAQLFTDSLIAVTRASFRTVEVERSQSSTGQFSQPWNLTGRGERHDLDRLHRGDALQLRGGYRWLIKNHSVSSGVTQLSTSDVDGLVVPMVAKGAQSLRGLGCRRLVARDDDRRRRIEIVEQFPEGAGTGAPRNCHVPDQRHLVIRRHLRRLGFGRANSTRPAGVALEKILDLRIGFARDDHSACLAQLAQQRFESADGGRAFLEYVVDPGERDRPNRVSLENRGTHERGQLGGRAGDSENRSRFENPARTRRGCDRHDLDSRRSGKSKDRLGDGQRRFTVARDDEDLRPTSNRVHPAQNGSKELRDRFRGVWKGVNEILNARALRRCAFTNFFQFRHL